MVRIGDFPSLDPGSIPGVGNFLFLTYLYYILVRVSINTNKDKSPAPQKFARRGNPTE